jgi:GcrA cell cycle regulator
VTWKDPTEAQPVTWKDPARVELLKQMWADGYSSTVIAARLGGVTRNAVVGKAHRLGLAQRGKAPVRHARPRPKPAPNPAAPRPKQPKREFSLDIGKPRNLRPPLPGQPLPPPAAEDVARIATLDLEPHHCRWPTGDPLEAGATRPLFCGKKKSPGLPYCPDHARRAYATPPVLSQEAAVAPAHEMEAVA